MYQFMIMLGEGASAVFVKCLMHVFGLPRSPKNMQENWATVQEDWQLSERELDRISLLDRGARVGFDPNLIA
jgi:hypothetical protein